jgi:hypothetical protein
MLVFSHISNNGQSKVVILDFQTIPQNNGWDLETNLCFKTIARYLEAKVNIILLTGVINNWL